MGNRGIAKRFVTRHKALGSLILHFTFYILHLRYDAFSNKVAGARV